MRQSIASMTVGVVIVSVGALLRINLPEACQQGGVRSWREEGSRRRTWPEPLGRMSSQASQPSPLPAFHYRRNEEVDCVFGGPAPLWN